MSVKKLCTKVRIYNEVADAIGTDKIIMEISVQDPQDTVKVFSYTGYSYRAFKHTILAEYTDAFAKKLFANSKLSFIKSVKIDDSIVSVRAYTLPPNPPN